MKRIVLLLLMFTFTLCGEALSQSKKGSSDSAPKLTFVETEHNFGEVSESGNKVSHDFIFTNTGSCPLVITRIITSCRCVDTSYSKRPIPPGGEGMVSITYNPKKQQGVFYKAIQVHSNAVVGMQILAVKGEVKP